MSSDTAGGAPSPTSAAVDATATAADSNRDGEAEDLYGSLCGICYTEVDRTLNPRGRLNSCNHLFCSYCIKMWGKKTNVCPTCKARFTRIYTIDATSGVEVETKVRLKNYNPDRDTDTAQLPSETTRRPDETAVNEFHYRELYEVRLVKCNVCRNSGNAARMIFCDNRKCTFAAHLDCLGTTERPLTFLCSDCTALRAPSSLATCATGGDSTVSATAPLPLSASTTPSVSGASPVRAVAPTAAPTPAARSSGATNARPTPTVPAAAAPPRRGPFTHPPPPRPRAVSSSEVPSRSQLLAAAPSAAVAPSPSSPSAVDAVDDDLYFLSPTAHSRQAAKDLAKYQESRQHEAGLRRARVEAKRRRMEETLSPHELVAHGLVGQPNMVGLQQRQRHAVPAGGPVAAIGSPLEQRRQMLEMTVADLTDPARRARYEESAAREEARAMLPLLRRNHRLEQDRLRLGAAGSPIHGTALSRAEYEEREAKLWQTAMDRAGAVVRKRTETQVMELRARMERLVEAQAQREAAALAKLARIIAAHRGGNGS